ncbi:hypothetical protein BJ322DRAFT_143843 [Thelephora terrestris]|uniref:F-box domain-containing protein n=1 Tax=Thelephora terrestris TaxID=56493 RepID=A0A9P6HBN8_9AGAM|nr:hypothetical protein BJ322DRAFT_143843 [Thelephora terrestris]
MSRATRDGRLARSARLSLSGIELFPNAVWGRFKAKFVGGLARRRPSPPTDLSQRRSFPPEIVIMIVDYLKYNTPTLKACAATCSTWYRIAAPHIHRTLLLREWPSTRSVALPVPNRLPFLREFGLLPFVERLLFGGEFARGPARGWIGPAVFNSWGTPQDFRAMVNLQELDIWDLDFSEFPEGLGSYLGHFAPTLRSVALSWPKGTRRQLLDFFMLFPKLENIGISRYPEGVRYEPLDNKPIVPISGVLRGTLTLKEFGDVELLKDMAVAFGGMGFTCMDLKNTPRAMRFVLDACADTLETLCIYPPIKPYDASSPTAHDFNLSSSTALRSIEVSVDSLARLEHLFSTITSPVFSELVVIFPLFPAVETQRTMWAESLVGWVRGLYEVRACSVVFCYDGPETSAHAREMRLMTRRGAEAGLYDFLPRPPSVVYRPF